MGTNKKYYWLKLKDDFFTQKEIKKLRKIAGGDTYTIIYLKLQLLSLKNGGKLYFEDVEETFEEEMALTLDEEVENVRFTLMFLEKHGLIEEVSQTEFMLPKTIESIGSETQSTVRSRKCRENQRALQCNTTATQLQQNATKCNTEIEIDIEKEKDIEIERRYRDIDEISATTTKNVYEIYQENIAPIVKPMIAEEIQSYVEDMGEELIIEAIRRSVANKKCSWGYCKGILNNWIDKGITTVEQARNEQKIYSKAVKSDGSRDSSKSDIDPNREGIGIVL